MPKIVRGSADSIRIEGTHSKLTDGGGFVAQRAKLSCSVVRLPRATKSLQRLGKSASFVQASRIQCAITAVDGDVGVKLMLQLFGILYIDLELYFLALGSDASTENRRESGPLVAGEKSGHAQRRCPGQYLPKVGVAGVDEGAESSISYVII